MHERLLIPAILVSLSSIATFLITKVAEKWFGRRYDKLTALEEFMIKTNDGKDVVQHLEEAKVHRLTWKQESESLKEIVGKFPDLIKKLDDLTKSVEHLDKNFRNREGETAMARMAEAFNNMADQFEEFNKKNDSKSK